MRIGIETWGSDGDIRPFFALGGGLAARGHEVTIVTASVDDKDYAQLAAALGVKYVKFVDKLDLDFDYFRERFHKTRNSLKLLKELFEEGFFPYVGRLSELAKSLCETCDVAIGHFFMYPLKAAAAKAKVPYVSVTLCHALVPTRYRPPLRMPDLGRILNRVEWEFVEMFLDLFLKKPVKAFWDGEGLPPFRHILSDLATSDLLNLLPVSEVFCKPCPDWNSLHKVVGFFNMPEHAEKWSPSLPLQGFLEEGEPPVYMTFGSTGQVIPEESAELMISAARIAGCRAIIQPYPSAKYRPGTREGSVYFIGKTPHQYIFPRCAAVVHHGGAGTTHSATRAGRPSVVVHFSDEQMFWGLEMKRLGAAGEPISIRKATPERLARAVRLVLDSPDIRRRAEEVGEIMRKEDGVGKAVGIVEGLAASRTSRAPGSRMPP